MIVASYELLKVRSCETDSNSSELSATGLCMSATSHSAFVTEEKERIWKPERKEFEHSNTESTVFSAP